MCFRGTCIHEEVLDGMMRGPKPWCGAQAGPRCGAQAGPRLAPHRRRGVVQA